MRRCQGITGSGKRCERLIGPSQTHCYSHDETRAKERRENASKAAKARYATPCAEIVAVREQLSTLAEDVRQGKVTTAKGAVVAQILGVLLKTFEQARKQAEFDEIRVEMGELREMFERQREARNNYG